MVLVALIVHLIAAVLGGWGATLLCRLVVVRLDRRRRRPGVAPVLPLTPRQQTAGLVIAGIVLPLSIIIAVIGEGLRSNFDASYGVADKLIMSAAAMLLILAVGAASAGWFYDPPRGRRRCPSCWYDMATIVGRCPECGRETPSERSLSRTRRSGRLLALAPVLLVVGGSLYFVRLVRGGGAAAVLPTGVLIAGLPWLPRSVLDVEEHSLGERLRGDRTSAELRDRVAARCRDVIHSTKSVETAERMVLFYDDVLMAVPPQPTLSSEVTVDLFTSLFATTPVSEFAVWERWARLSRYLPRRIDPATTTALRPDVQRGLTSPHSYLVKASLDVAALMGADAMPFLPSVRAIVADRGRSEEIRRSASIVLFSLAATSDEAWNGLLEVVAGEPDLFSPSSPMSQPNSFVNATAWLEPTLLPASIAIATTALEPRLASVLHDDDVGAWAAGVLVAWSPDPEKHLPQILEAMDRWPPIDVALTMRLAERIPASPQVIARVERLLRSDDVGQQLDGARAASSLGRHGVVLLPLLRERMDQLLHDRFAYVSFLFAIKQIEDAANAP